MYDECAHTLLLFITRNVWRTGHCCVREDRRTTVCVCHEWKRWFPKNLKNRHWENDNSPLEIITTNERNCIRLFPRVVFKCVETFGNLSIWQKNHVYINIIFQVRFSDFTANNRIFFIDSLWYRSTYTTGCWLCVYLDLSKSVILNLCRFSGHSST